VARGWSTAVYAKLPDGTGWIGFVLFGPSGGARSYAQGLPRYFHAKGLTPHADVYYSANDREVTTYFQHKATPQELKLRDDCLKAADGGQRSATGPPRVHS
jgi:hypothetical protein